MPPALQNSGVLNALTDSSSYTLQSGVAYGALPRQKLDIYTPTRIKPADGWPAVVFFYGGSWNSGARADYRFVAEALAARGGRVARQPGHHRGQRLRQPGHAGRAHRFPGAALRAHAAVGDRLVAAGSPAGTFFVVD